MLPLPRRMWYMGSSPGQGLVYLQHTQLPQMLIQGAVPEVSWTGPVTKHWMWWLHSAVASRPEKNYSLTPKPVPWLYSHWYLRPFCRRAATKVALVCITCSSDSKGQAVLLSTFPRTWAKIATPACSYSSCKDVLLFHFYQESDPFHIEANGKFPT